MKLSGLLLLGLMIGLAVVLPVNAVSLQEEVIENPLIMLATNTTWSDLYMDDSYTLHLTLSGQETGYIVLIVNLTHIENAINRSINNLYISGNITKNLIENNSWIGYVNWTVQVPYTFENESGKYTFYRFEERVFKVANISLVFHCSVNKLEVSFGHSEHNESLQYFVWYGVAVVVIICMILIILRRRRV